jgi:hypothetical protein
MTVNFVPILVAIVGLLLYAFAPNTKAQRVGEILLFAGVLAALLPGGSHGITIH